MPWAANLGALKPIVLYTSQPFATVGRNKPSSGNEIDGGL
jgi:hypothetical protein